MTNYIIYITTEDNEEIRYTVTAKYPKNAKLIALCEYAETAWNRAIKEVEVLVQVHKNIYQKCFI